MGRRGGAVVGFLHARRHVLPDTLRWKQVVRSGEASSRSGDLAVCVSIIVPVGHRVGSKREASLDQWDQEAITARRRKYWGYSRRSRGSGLAATGPLAVAMDGNKSGYRAGVRTPGAGTRGGRLATSRLEFEDPLLGNPAALGEAGLQFCLYGSKSGESSCEVRASGSSFGRHGGRLGRDVTVLSIRLGRCRRRSCSVQLPEQLGFSLGSKTLALGSQAAHL